MSRLEEYEVSETKLKQIVEAVGHRRIPVSFAHPVLFLAKASGIPVDFDDWSAVPIPPYSCDLSAHIRAGLGMNLFVETTDGLRVRDTGAKREADPRVKKFRKKIYYSLRYNNKAAGVLTLQEQYATISLMAGMVWCLTKGITGSGMLETLQAPKHRDHWFLARKLLFWLLTKEEVVVPLTAG